jgi:GTP:adenosylcobinamide-phosphate guanylyltransferase
MFDSQSEPPFTALVLAGDRGPEDPLIRHTGATCKAMVKIQGVPMLYRVLNSLEEATQVKSALLSGPAKSVFTADRDLTRRQTLGTIEWYAAGPSPSTSAHQIMRQALHNLPFLLTTADHPLLSANVIDEFCQKSLQTGADVTVGLAPYALVQEQFPDMKKTVIKMKDGHYCGCNLFTFLTTNGVRAAEFWRNIERQRKRPLKLISMLGWGYVMRYRLGLLTLNDALQRLSELLGLRIQVVILPYGEAAVDVDSVSDHALVEARLQRQV